MLQAEGSIEEIVSQLSDCYGGETEEIDAAVRQFIGTLFQAEVIVETLAPLARLAMPPLTAKTRFVPPSLEKHSDIQDLLLLDPIHEVAQSGWPMRKG